MPGAKARAQEQDFPVLMTKQMVEVMNNVWWLSGMPFHISAANAEIHRSNGNATNVHGSVSLDCMNREQTITTKINWLFSGKASAVGRPH